MANYKCNKTADERPNLYYPITNPNTGEEIWPSRDAVWRYSKERHDENVANDMVFWGKEGTGKTPAFKRYRHMLRGGGGIVPGTWWTYEFAGHNDEAAKELSELIGNRIFSTSWNWMLRAMLPRITMEISGNIKSIVQSEKKLFIDILACFAYNTRQESQEWVVKS